MKTKQQPSNVSVMMKIILLLGANLTIIGGSSLMPGIPAIEAEFSDVPNTAFLVSMIITLPALFVVIGGPVAGLLTDKLGRKWVLAGSILLGAISGSAGLIVNSLGVLLLTRALVGLSMAGANTANNALISDYFDGQERARFLGLQAAFTGLGGVLCMPLGGILADINWHMSFVTYLPLFVLFPLAIIFIRESPASPVPDDNTPAPKLRTDGVMRYIFAVNLICQFAFLSVAVSVGNFLGDILNASGVETGFALALSSVFYFIGGLLYESISRHITFRNLTTVCLIIAGLSFVFLALADSWIWIILAQMLSGLSFGLTVSNLSTWLAARVDIPVRGRANGLLITMGFLGQFLTSLIVAPLVKATSYQTTYLFSAVLITLMIIVGSLFQKGATPIREA